MPTADPKAMEEFSGKLKALVEPKVAEPVLGALSFSRRGFFTQKAAGRAGLAFYLAAKVAAKQQAAGLPERFVLAVTPTKVHAFEHKVGMLDRDGIGRIEDEVAVWDRAGLQVSSQDAGGFFIDVILESPAEGERVECRTGRSDYARELLRGLAAGPAR
jgi:hypothetical protein